MKNLKVVIISCLLLGLSSCSTLSDLSMMVLDVAECASGIDCTDDLMRGNTSKEDLERKNALATTLRENQLKSYNKAGVSSTNLQTNPVYKSSHPCNSQDSWKGKNWLAYYCIRGGKKVYSGASCKASWEESEHLRVMEDTLPEGSSCIKDRIKSKAWYSN